MDSEKKYTAEITIDPIGALTIEGNFIIKNSNGEIINAGKKVRLCRCGKSDHKPFCDDNHKNH